jgi:predicted dehydrogenase
MNESSFEPHFQSSVRPLKRVAATPATRKPRLGFLGVGWIGRHRMEAVAASELAEIVGVVDPSAENARAAAAASPQAEVMKSFAEMLDRGLDGVVIATPSALHAEQALEALDHGIAVFCQKPLARNAGETRAVVSAAERADRLLGVDLSYRFTTALRAVRETVRHGRIGRVFAADLVFHNAYGPDKPWAYDPRLSGGGCVIDLGTHLVDAGLWILDYPEVHWATSRLYHRGVMLLPDCSEVEDYATARLDLADGVSLQVSCSWKLSVGQDAVFSATFYGTEGTAEMRNVDGSFYHFRADRLVGTTRQPLVSPPDDWGGRATVDWTRRLAARTGFDPEAHRFVDLAVAIDHVYHR